MTKVNEIKEVAIKYADFRMKLDFLLGVQFAAIGVGIIFPTVMWLSWTIALMCLYALYYVIYKSGAVRKKILNMMKIGNVIAFIFWGVYLTYHFFG